MGKVEKANSAINKRKANGDQSIDTTHYNTIRDNLLHVMSPLVLSDRGPQ
jgi:hypothetical protein